MKSFWCSAGSECTRRLRSIQPWSPLTCPSSICSSFRYWVRSSKVISQAPLNSFISICTSNHCYLSTAFKGSSSGSKLVFLVNLIWIIMTVVINGILMSSKSEHDRTRLKMDWTLTNTSFIVRSRLISKRRLLPVVHVDALALYSVDLLLCIGFFVDHHFISCFVRNGSATTTCVATIVSVQQLNCFLSLFHFFFNLIVSLNNDRITIMNRFDESAASSISCLLFFRTEDDDKEEEEEDDE